MYKQKNIKVVASAHNSIRNISKEYKIHVYDLVHECVDYLATKYPIPHKPKSKTRKVTK